ncbi:hypothetical protein RJ639_024707 [Escallonia herrerae]|uniref:Reverse transcriptase/retrotransposon-derived protein RNase H-like domain-containing protein n=1 Tax=Escallonia herrerae TaxID=1293975 RepID=A0AA88S6I6_9ASTE|nr:hypothetical protein RJ639_024707 [Escallonia herrerae]
MCKRAIMGGAIVTPSPRVDEPKLKEFGGKRDAKELHNFIWHMERYLEGASVTDEKAKVQTDASEFAIGGVLMQEGHPIAFESRKLNDTERSPNQLHIGRYNSVILKARGEVLGATKDHSEQPRPKVYKHVLDGANQTPWLGATLLDELSPPNKWAYRKGERSTLLLYVALFYCQPNGLGKTFGRGAVFVQIDEERGHKPKSCRDCHRATAAHSLRISRRLQEEKSFGNASG